MTRFVVSPPGAKFTEEVAGSGPPHGYRVRNPEPRASVDTTLSRSVRASGTGDAKERVSATPMRPLHPWPVRESTTRSPVRALKRMGALPSPNQPQTSTTTCTGVLAMRHMAPPEPSWTIVWLARISPARKFTVDVAGGEVPHG